MVLFCIKIHHGGTFVTEGRVLKYMDAYVDHIDNNESDVCNFMDLKSSVSDMLKYTNIECFWYLIPGQRYDKGLRRLLTDKDVAEMCAHVEMVNDPKFELNMFVQHKVEENMFREKMCKEIEYPNVSTQQSVLKENCILGISPTKENDNQVYAKKKVKLIESLQDDDCTGLVGEFQTEGRMSDDGEEGDVSDQEFDFENEDNDSENGCDRFATAQEGCVTENIFSRLSEGNDDETCNPMDEEEGNDLNYSDGDVDEESDEEVRDYRRRLIDIRVVNESRVNDMSGHVDLNANSSANGETNVKAALFADGNDRPFIEVQNADDGITASDWAALEREMNVISDSNPSAESSEDEEGSFKKKKCKKYGAFNPKTVVKDIKFWVGQEFTNGEEFKVALKGYAISNKLDLRLMKNDKQRVIAVCNNNEVCPWRIYASPCTHERTWKVRTIRDEHQCSENVKSRQLKAKWIARHYYGRIKATPSWKLDDIKATLLADFSLDVCSATVGKAKRIALAALMSSMVDHYALVWDYRNELRKTNPHSTIEAYCVINNPVYGPVFQRFYVCFSALKKGLLDGCRRVLGIDGCFLKGCMKGELLIAVGRDANNQMFPVAWAVVQKETKNSWCWFINHLITDLAMEEGEGWTIISDQHKGLIAAVELLLPRSEHRACARHVYANWSKNYRGREYKIAFWSIAKSTHMLAYEKYCKKLKDLNEEAYKDLMNRNPEKWCKAFFNCDVQCDSCENNMSEGFNGTLLEARAKPLIYMLEHLRMNMMTRLHMKREWMSNHWDVIPPRIRKKVQDNVAECRLWKANYNGNGKFQVDYMKNGFVVDIEKRECTCREWQLTGIPCCHAISGLLKIGKKPEDYISEWYKKETFLKAYAHSIEPITGENNWVKCGDTPMKPPMLTSMPGRPKIKRKKAAHEEPKGPPVPPPKTKKLPKNGQIITCGNCKQIGHNKRKCKNPAVESNGASNKGDVILQPKERSKAKVKEKVVSNAAPVEKIYSKKRNEGRKKPPETMEGEKRKRGRPRKVQMPRHDFVGIYNAPNGMTFFKTAGSTQPVNLSNYVLPSQDVPISSSAAVAACDRANTNE